MQQHKNDMELAQLQQNATNTREQQREDRKDKRIKMTYEEKNLFGIDKLNVPRSSVPSITHVDYSARIQTVHKETNPKYYDLIKEFKKITNCPVLVNTSFNVRER